MGFNGLKKHQTPAKDSVRGSIGLENFCSIVESLAPWTDKTPVEKRATRADYEDALAEVGCSWKWDGSLIQKWLLTVEKHLGCES